MGRSLFTGGMVGTAGGLSGEEVEVADASGGLVERGFISPGTKLVLR